MADKARTRVRRMPVRGRSGHTGLRRRVAQSVRVIDVPRGVRITTVMAQRDEDIIPRGMNRPSGWRHPVFGQRAVWVRQRPMRAGWFSDSMDRDHEIAVALDDTLEDSADRIARRGNVRGIPGI